MQKKRWRTFLYRDHVLLLLRLLETDNSNDNNASLAKRAQARSKRAQREPANHAINGRLAARVSVIEAPTAAMSIQMDLQHLLHQLHLQHLLQYLLLHLAWSTSPIQACCGTSACTFSSACGSTFGRCHSYA